MHTCCVMQTKVRVSMQWSKKNSSLVQQSQLLRTCFFETSDVQKTDLKTLEVRCESNSTRGTTCPWIIWSFEYVIPSNFRFVTCNLYWNGDIMHDSSRAKCRICSCECNVNNTFCWGNLILFFFFLACGRNANDTSLPSRKHQFLSLCFPFSLAICNYSCTMHTVT